MFCHPRRHGSGCLTQSHLEERGDGIQPSRGRIIWFLSGEEHPRHRVRRSEIVRELNEPPVCLRELPMSFGIDDVLRGSRGGERPWVENGIQSMPIAEASRSTVDVVGSRCPFSMALRFPAPTPARDAMLRRLTPECFRARRKEFVMLITHPLFSNTITPHYSGINGQPSAPSSVVTQGAIYDMAGCWTS